MKKYLSFNRILVAAIVLLTLLHVVLLFVSPPGFFLDESAGAAHVVAMLQQGANAHGQSWPLFSASLGGGYTTPIYLYPLVGWAAIFGTSELALRAFSLAATFVAIAAITATAALWRGRRFGLITAVVSLALPWGWIQGSVAWDPALVPAVTAMSLFIFTLLVRVKQKNQITTALLLVTLSLTLVALAYLYPPARVTAPQLFLVFYVVLLAKKVVSYRTAFVACLLALLAALPLAAFMFQPESLERSRELSVFHDQSILGGVGLFMGNIVLLLNPIFLFITGDPNLRHATGFQGVLGLAAVPAVIMVWVLAFKTLIRRRSISVFMSNSTVQLSLLCLIGIGFSVAGSALTNEGQPHSLRASAAWPFFAILLAIGWSAVLNQRRSIRIAAISIFAVATIAYVVDLAIYYPVRSHDAFDTDIVRQLQSGQDVPNYPNLSKQYYQNR